MTPPEGFINIPVPADRVLEAYATLGLLTGPVESRRIDAAVPPPVADVEQVRGELDALVAQLRAEIEQRDAQTEQLTRSRDHWRELAERQDREKEALQRRVPGLEARIKQLVEQLEEAGTAPVAPEGPAKQAAPTEAKPPPERPAKAPERPAKAPSDGKRTLDFGGPEKLPEHLRYLPVAHNNIAAASRLKVAEQQHEVLGVAQAKFAGKGFVAQELHEALPKSLQQKLPRARLSSYLRDLEDPPEGFGPFIVRLGARRAKGQTAGRTQVEYRVASDDDEEGAGSAVRAAQEPESEPERAAPDEAPLDFPVETDTPPLTAEVRDWVIQQEPGELFSAAKVGEENEWPWPVVLARFKELVRLGICEDESPTPDMPLFSYRGKPKEPGAAAKLDMQRRAAEAKANGQGSPPVAGTGVGLRISNQAVRKLVADAVKCGAEQPTSLAGNGHIEIKYKGRRVLIAGTPKSDRSVANDRARVRRIIPDLP
jgi:hypothetical protein